MITTQNKDYTSPFAIHPGEVIRDSLETLGMSQVDLSKRSQISEKTISLILNGDQPVTPETAAKMERVLGISYTLLTTMQARYEADQFRLSEQERLKNEITHLEKFPFYKELAKLGYVAPTKDSFKKVEELLKFFQLNSLSNIPNVFPVAFKKSEKKNISREALSAWLCIGTIESAKRTVEEFNMEKLKQNIPKMRALTAKKPEGFERALITLCAEAGVTLVFTPHLKNTHVNGAMRWLSSKKTFLVQISLYNKSADIFWFTVFHEIGHIVLEHPKKEFFIDDFESPNKTKMEEEANKYAQQVFIPKEHEKEFSNLKEKLSQSGISTAVFRENIVCFAKKVDIAPSIIAGRIGRELGVWNKVSSLREKFTFTS